MLVEKQKRGIFAPTNPKRPVRLGVRTADFHSVNRGSIPLRATKKNPQRKLRVLFLKVSSFDINQLCPSDECRWRMLRECLRRVSLIFF